MKLGRRSFLAASGAFVAGAAGCVTGDDGDTDSGGDGSADDGSAGNDSTADNVDKNGDANGTVDDRNGEGSRTADPDWSYDTGGSIATVANGVVYGREEFVDGTGGVVALDAETGERLWRYGETGGYSSYTAPVVADQVYFGFGDDAIGSGNGHVTAVTRGGTEQWSTETGSVYEPPVLDGESLYVGSDDGRLYCLRADTGEVRWSHRAGGKPENPSGPSVEAVDGGVVYASLAERVVALDAADGRERWIARPGESDLWRVRVDDRVYAATREQVAAIDGGRLAWTNDRIGRRVLAVRDGTVFVSDGVRLAALDADDGEERWHVETPDGHVARVGPDAVYLGVEDLQAIDTIGMFESHYRIDRKKACGRPAKRFRTSLYGGAALAHAARRQRDVPARGDRRRHLRRY